MLATGQNLSKFIAAVYTNSINVFQTHQSTGRVNHIHLFTQSTSVSSSHTETQDMTSTYITQELNTNKHTISTPPPPKP